MAFVPIFDITNRRKPRKFVSRQDPLSFYDEETFRERFRFSKGTFRYIHSLIGSEIEKNTQRNMAFSSELQILAALRFYSGQAYLKIIGDTLGISEPSMSRVVATVSACLSKRLDEFVCIPSDSEKLMRGFYEIANFPGIVGAVDGTHIRIQAPYGDQEPYYVNRKGYHSVNVQAICDSNGRFLNMVADWPGSTHDSRILGR